MEKQLIERCIKGERAAQEQLYMSYSRKVKGLCLRYARTVFEAEDILQEAFIKIFKNLKNYNNSGPFEAWMRRIVLNTAIDSYKSNLFLENQVNIDDTNELDLKPTVIGDNLTEQELLMVIGKLPDGYRMVFNLYAIEGYSHKEIAEMLNISEGTSKSQLSKARNYLKTLLVQYNYIEDEPGE